MDHATWWNFSAKEGHVHVWRCERVSHFVAVIPLTEKNPI